MKIEQYDKVELKDGRQGYVIEVFEEGVAYLFEFETPDGPHRYDDKTIYRDEIARVVGHVGDEG